MSDDREFASHVVDLLDPFGVAESKRMFGGFGIFHQGLMIALIAEGSLYLKADEKSRSLFDLFLLPSQISALLNPVKLKLLKGALQVATSAP